MLSHNDILRIDLDLPLEQAYYPLGYPLRIRTNSREVLRALDETWSGSRQEYDCPPIDFDVVVETGPPTGNPEHRARGHIYSVVSDPSNFAHIDMDRMSGAFFLSDATASDYPAVRWLYVESLAYMVLCQHYVVPLHAACLARGDFGVLLAGPGGSGKTTLAFAGALAGWTFVSDDCVFLLVDGDTRTVIGQPRQARFRMSAPEIFPELQRSVARARPNGKMSIEAPMKDFPEIRTAAKAWIGAVVLLDRRENAASCLTRIDSEQAIEQLLTGGPSYGPAVNEMHERAVRRLTTAPSYRLRFDHFRDALGVLNEIA